MRSFINNTGRYAIAFFRWWFSELRSLAPRSWALRKSSASEDLIEIRDEAIVVRSKGGEEYTLPHDKDLLREYLKKWRDAEHRIALLAADTGAMIRTKVLPAAAGGRVLAMTAMDIEREEPFERQSIYFDAVQVGDAAPGQIKAQQVFVKRAPIDKLVSQASALGIDYDAIRITEAHLDCNVMPPEIQQKRRAAFRRRLAGITAGCAAIGLLVLFSLADRQARTLNALSDKLASVRAEAIQTQSLSASAKTIIDKVSVLRNLKTTHPSALNVWESLSVAVPDSAWLTEFRLEGASVSITGYASDAAALINTLEDIENIADVSFTAPVTLDPRHQRERFSIAMTIVDEVGMEQSADIALGP